LSQINFRAFNKNWGGDIATVKHLRAGTIFVSITGSGLLGARGERPCIDLIAEGSSGWAD